MTAATGGVPLGWGFVGTGAVSRSVASDLALVAPARSIAVCSRDAGRARDFADELGVERAYDSLDAFLDDDAVEIVHIGTPHSTHADLAVRCLEAGKHVLVEKPMGVDAAEVERIATAARAAGLFAMEGMWMRFHPSYRALLAAARDGDIGEVTSVRATFGLPFGDRDSGRWSAELASSTLLDQGIYPVTLACDVLGQPTSIVAEIDAREDGVDVTVHATLGFAESRFAHIGASMVGYLDPSAAISGTRGWLELPAPFWATDRLVRHVGDLGAALTTPRTDVFDREGQGYVPMLRAVTDAVARGDTEHPDHPLSSTIAIARVLDAIRAAASAAPQNRKSIR